MPPTNDPMSWEMQAVHVLAELKRQATNVHDLRDDIQVLSLKGTEEHGKIMAEIAALKAESKLAKWVVGGIGGGVVMLAVELFIKLVTH